MILDLELYQKSSYTIHFQIFQIKFQPIVNFNVHTIAITIINSPLTYKVTPDLKLERQFIHNMHDNTVFSILKCAKNVYLSPKSVEKNNVYIAVRIDKVQFFAGCGIVRNLVFYKRKYEKKIR